MEQCDKKYVTISDEERRQFQEAWYECAVSDFRKDMVDKDVYKYEVVLQDIRFITYMTDEELKLSAGFAVDLLEELKNINNSGVNREVYERTIEEMEQEEEVNLFRVIGIWNKIGARI